jgi:hypothetical protein
MSHDQPPEGYEPIRGEARWPLVLNCVLLGAGVVFTVAALVATLVVGDTGGLLLAAVAVLVLGIIGVTWSGLSRRAYLRDVRNGTIVVRRPWRGDNLGPTG